MELIGSEIEIDLFYLQNKLRIRSLNENITDLVIRFST